MIETMLLSSQFALMAGLAIGLTALGGRLIRAMPWTEPVSAVPRQEVESIEARMMRALSLWGQYAAFAWIIFHFDDWGLQQWIVVWVLFLLLRLARKVCQFHSPQNWEQTSFQFDSKMIWWLNLIVISSIELQIPTTMMPGIATLLGLNIFLDVIGDGTWAGAAEDVFHKGLGLLSLGMALGYEPAGLPLFFGLVLGVLVLVRFFQWIVGKEVLRGHGASVAGFSFVVAMAMKAWCS